MARGRSLFRIRGAIGKQVVHKQYKRGEVVSKYPDMSRIVASSRQRGCRNLFKEAVAYARDINNDPEKKKAYQKKIGRNKIVFNAAISEYMKKVKEENGDRASGKVL
jgi:hypothetical protein